MSNTYIFKILIVTGTAKHAFTSVDFIISYKRLTITVSVVDVLTIYKRKDLLHIDMRILDSVMQHFSPSPPPPPPPPLLLSKGVTSTIKSYIALER